MTTIETSIAAIEVPGDGFVVDDAELAAVAFLAATAAAPSTLTATICAGSFSGRPTTILPCSPRRGRTSSSIAAGWKTAGWLRRPSPDAARRCSSSASERPRQIDELRWAVRLYQLAEG